MAIATGVYDFPQTIERAGEETTIHPSAVETPTGLLLIDVGFPGLVDQVGDNLAATGHGWDDVRAVILTHQDGDHAGGLEEVLDRTDVVVYAHERCAPYVDGRKQPIKSPEGERYPAVDVDVELVDGVRFRTAAGAMDVVFTPGHAPGHIALHFPAERLLLAADALTADASGLAGPSEEYTLAMDEALESVETLADREIDRIHCYHGGTVEADPAAMRAVCQSTR